MKSLRVLLALVLVVLWTAGCSKHPFPTATVDVDGHSVWVELATDPELRARGLMHRDSLSADAGMLFIYPDERTRSFWMKNTRIPLDIAFADSSGKIVRITDMKPFSTDPTPSLYPARYALEMNVGWFEAHDVETGAVIAGIPEIEVQ